MYRKIAYCIEYIKDKNGRNNYQKKLRPEYNEGDNKITALKS